MKGFQKYLIIVGSVFMLLACGGGNSKTPEGVIPKDKMIEVIAEIELTQALIKLKSSTQDTINEQELYNEVYQDYNISQEKFNRSLKHYCENPKSLMNMYGKVIENLTKKQSEQQGK